MSHLPGSPARSTLLNYSTSAPNPTALRDEVVLWLRQESTNLQGQAGRTTNSIMRTEYLAQAAALRAAAAFWSGVILEETTSHDQTPQA